MTSAQKAKITGLGYDENFGGLDLSGCPSLQSLPSEDWIDDRFAQPDRTGNGNDLKEFIKQQTAEHTPPKTVHANGNELSCKLPLRHLSGRICCTALPRSRRVISLLIDSFVENHCFRFLPPWNNRKGSQRELRRTTVPATEEFSGKRIPVTGGTKSAGKASADRFLQRGGSVIVEARSAPVERGDAYFVQADVATPDGTARIIRETFERFHGIDIIVHNVGGSSAPSGVFRTVTEELHCHTAPTFCRQVFLDGWWKIRLPRGTCGNVFAIREWRLAKMTGATRPLRKSGWTDEPFLNGDLARQYFEIVSEPKKLKIYSAPHALNLEATGDRIAFLAEQLSFKPPDAKTVAAIPALFQPPWPKPPRQTD